MGMRQMGRRGLVAGVAALVGASVARLAGPRPVDAAVNPVQTDSTTNSAADTAIANTGSGAAGNLTLLEYPAVAVFASRVSNSTTQGRFGVLGRIGVAATALVFNTDVVTAGVWGVTARIDDNAFGVRGDAHGAGAGVYGDGFANGIGVWGDATARMGMFGTSTANVGVFGVSKSSGANTTPPPPSPSGVAGQGFGRIGVQGVSDSAVGVSGTSTSSVGVSGTSASAAGVSGTSTSAPGVFGTSVTAFGVQGLSTNAYGVSGNSTTQAGVWGSSSSNVGVLGTSTSGVGVNGVSDSSNGVNGVTTSGIGVYGSSGGSGLAGRFDGNVVVQGNLTVSGSFPHSAAVPSSDGTVRRLYSFEGTEAYYEDLGQGSLTNGVGTVILDPAFAALVRADAYQVFLTAYGDNRGLFVSNQTASGFEVREVQGGTSSIGFGYRVVARPRDLPTSRLDRVTLPPSPAQPRLDRVEPLDVPATLRDLHR
jgi:hypothetical protein